MTANQQPKPKVVVTGLGAITSLGHDAQSFWSNLLDGKSGIGRVTRFDPGPFTCKVASEVIDFDPSQFMDAKEVRRSDPFTHYAMAAAKMAIEDSDLDLNAVDKERIGVIIGSGIGGIETLEKAAIKMAAGGPRKVSPFMIPSLIANMASGIVAIEIGAMGPNFGLVSACSSASHSIGESLKLLRSGGVDVMIAGGSEAAVTPLAFAGFCSARAMSTSFNDEPQRASRPFDAKRDGFIMGEGSGILILETLEYARARGARIYCELAGYAASSDAYHITSPHPEGSGLILCIRKALADADINSIEIDYINAHGTSTLYNDKAETKAIRDVFGDHADKLLVSSTKSMTGHLLGAAGAIEAIAAIKAIETGQVPPTINYENPDPDCDLNYVPNEKVCAPIKVAMSNNMGFGGHNASIVLRALEK